MSAPRLFGEPRVPIATWASEFSQAQAPGRNRYYDEDFRPAHVDSFAGSDFEPAASGANYVIDSGRGPAAPPSPVRIRPEEPPASVADVTPLTLGALKVLNAANKAKAKAKHRAEAEAEAAPEPEPEPEPEPVVSQKSAACAPPAEVMPDDSLSMQQQSGDDGDGGDDEVASSSGWLERVRQVHASEPMFHSSITRWATGVRDEALWEPAASAAFDMGQWRHEDLTIDPATGLAVRVPQAPQVLLDGAGREGAAVAQRRATQTANAACAMSTLGSLRPQQAEQGAEQEAPPARAPSTAPSGAPLNDPSDDATADAAVVALEAKETQEAQETQEAHVAQAETPARVVQLRAARESDIDAMLAIYNEEAAKGTQAWGGEAATAQDFASRLAACRAAQLPFVVAVLAKQQGAQVVGLAFLSRARPVWRNAIALAEEPATVQAQVYVRMRYRTRGIGSELLRHLLDAHDGTGKRAERGTVAVDVMCGSENGLLEREYERVLTQVFGFAAAGEACDTMHWSKKTSQWVKMLRFCHGGQAKAAEEEEAAEAAEAEGRSSAASTTPAPLTFGR